jgi:aryl-alcohol dehydrogenase-like predicted oxidoreductase
VSAPRSEQSAIIPRIAMGCATFGGVGSLTELLGQGDSRDVAFASMDAAWEGGIRWFDTADAYGGGLSEQWIGEWIDATGNRPKVATKTYNPMPPTHDSGLSRERVLRQIESSLDRLGIQRVDLYLAHEFDPLTPIVETFDVFEELVDEGTIGAYGVSNFTAEQLQAAVDGGAPSVVQNSYSLLNRRDERDVIPLANANGIVYQAYSPLAGGWLSGKYRAGEPMPPASRLALVPQWYEHIDEARAFRALWAMEELAAAQGTSVAALALGWVLAQRDIAGIVIGPRRAEHFAPVWAARSDDLQREVVSELTSVFAVDGA